MGKLPWFPFYGRDFFFDEKVKLFSLRQVGIYLALLWHQWEHGSIPSMQDCQRFPMMGQDLHSEQLTTLTENHPNGPFCLSSVEAELKHVHMTCFVAHPSNKKSTHANGNRYYNPRLESIREEQSRKDEVFQARARLGGLAKAAASSRNKQTASTALVVLSPANQSQSQIKSQKKKEKEGRMSAPRGSVYPDGFQPDEKHAEIARGLGLVLSAELATFRDHHAAKGTVFKDWPAAFRNWLRRSHDFKTRSGR